MIFELLNRLIDSTIENDDLRESAKVFLELISQNVFGIELGYDNFPESILRAGEKNALSNEEIDVIERQLKDLKISKSFEKIDLFALLNS